MAEVHERYVRSLEQAGVLNRELEFLPSIEVFEERAASGGGLTAPEFAILLSHTKVALSQALLASELPDDPYLAGELALYFPSRLREQFPEQLERHSLRREIIATRIANDLVNRAGTTFLYRLGDETGAAPDEIARAYTAAREVAGLRELWAAIEALDGRSRPPRRRRCCSVPASCSSGRRAGSSATVAGRSTSPRPSPATHPGRPRSPKRCRRCSGVGDRGSEGARQGAHRRRRPGRARGARLAAAIARPGPRSGRDRGRVRARRRRRSPRSTSRSESGSSCSGCATGSSACRATRAGPRWLELRLRDDVYAEQASLTAHVVRSGANGQPARGLVESWLRQNAAAVERSRQVLADIRSGGALDLARLSVAVRELRNLIQSSGAGQRAEESAAAPPAP